MPTQGRQRVTTAQGVKAEFVEADLRELEFEDEFESPSTSTTARSGISRPTKENHRTFEAISCALKPGGKNLVQLPNVLYARPHLP